MISNVNHITNISITCYRTRIPQRVADCFHVLQWLWTPFFCIWNAITYSFFYIFALFFLYILHNYPVIIPVLRSAKRAPANVRRLNNISDVIFYCSIGERSRALALLHAAQMSSSVLKLAFQSNLILPCRFADLLVEVVVRLG